MSATPIIVVGAGMAGLMAARTLHNAGHKVICLEGRDRIGGRTHTDHSLGISVDLGAAWIHGPIGNPLTPLADLYGVGYGTTDFINRAGNVVQAYDATGRPLDMVAYTQGQLLAKAAFAKMGASLLYTMPDDNCRSLQDLIKYGLPLTEGLSPDQQAGFHYWSVIRTEYGDAADGDTIDWRLGDAYAMLPGDDLLLHGGGYNLITDGLAAGLDIRTGVKIEAIHTRESGVRLTTSAGVFEADGVIITVPLGVLKAGAIRFEPALPAAKQAAIDRVGFGHYEKLIMRFDDFYWPRDKQRLNFLSDPEPGEPPLFHAWLNLGYYTDEPVLMAYHAGRRARHINGWGDGELLERTLSVMQRIFGDNGYGDIPAPLAHVRSGWQSDPFAQGSYSFDQIGQRPGDRELLAEPVGRRLFFAGEATHPHFYATVHGAYETGVRAAQEVQAALATRDR